MSAIGTDGPRLTRTLRVKNVTTVLQGVGFTEFQPGEIKDVLDHIAVNLVALPYFEFVDNNPGWERNAGQNTSATRGAPTQITFPPVPLADDVRRMIEPDPPTEGWIAAHNASVFPCATAEFDPVAESERKIRVTFRMRDLAEMNGGTRVVLRLCGHLKRRGHEVAVSVANTPLRDDEIGGVRITNAIPDADVLVGTFWTTIRELVDSGPAGKLVGFLQSNEPSWMQPGEAQRKRCIEAVTQPTISYIAISRQVAESCNRDYGTLCPRWINGNGVDTLDFSPRINNFERRNGVCAIYRGVWFKSDTFVLDVMEKLKLAIPGMKSSMAGFKRFSHRALDSYLCDPSVDDMALFYSNSDVYLSGSKIEGSPLPPLEAMACGCIPVTTGIGTEEYLVDGHNGFVIPPDDEDAAVSCVRRIMDDDALRRLMIRNALATARSRTWDTVGEQFERFLLQVA